jgi:hypothetical protein
MIQNKINYRLAELPREEKKILELMKVCFGRDFRKDWFQWFNYNCPYGKNRVYVGEDIEKNTLVAAYGLLPYKIVINKKVMNGSLCTNVMTHPEYRGKGIFTQIGRYALLQETMFVSYFSVGVPNKNALPGHLKVGWIIHSDLIFFKKFDNKKIDFKGEQVFEFTEEHGRLASTLLANMNFAIAKDSDFLNWRYFKRPDNEYITYEIRKEKKLRGFIILKYFTEKEYKKLHILDIYAIDKHTFSDLLKIPINLASDCDELNCWQIKNSPYVKLFLELDFHASNEKNALILFKNKGKEEFKISNSSWWFMLGDNDVY